MFYTYINILGFEKFLKEFGFLQHNLLLDMAQFTTKIVIKGAGFLFSKRQCPCLALLSYLIHVYQVDVELAKQSADRPEDEEELRKKLWLKIGIYESELWNMN